jgi:flagellar hook-basal body complex protein FliE
VSVEAIEFIAPSRAIAPFAPSGELDAAQTAEGASHTFAAWFSQQVQRVDGELATADGHLQALAMGETQNLHQVMISLEEARLSFQLLMQVRNRVLEAYQEVMRMQV